MKYQFTILCFLYCAICYGQIQLEQQALSNSGGFGEDRNISVSWTLGQTAIATLENLEADIILTQGFQQPDVNNQIPIENFGIGIYPNPVETSLTLQLEPNRFDFPLQVQLINTKSEIIRVFEVESEQSTVQMGDLPDGIYFISLLLRGGRITHSVLKMSSK